MHFFIKIELVSSKLRLYVLPAKEINKIRMIRYRGQDRQDTKKRVKYRGYYPAYLAASAIRRILLKSLTVHLN